MGSYMKLLTGTQPTGRRRALGIAMGLAMATSLVVAVPAQAAVAPGAKCTKVNAKTKTVVAGKNVTLTCKVASGRRVWTDTRVISLSVIANAIKGGKNTVTAEFIQDYVIPNFSRDAAIDGYTVRISFAGRGVADEDYKAALALDLRSKRGADIMAFDGFWIGEFAEAGYIKPLERVVGRSFRTWEGWSQINRSVQALTSHKGQQYGIPQGTDGRLLYFHKGVFEKAGLPANWQPRSWADVLTAAKTIKDKVPGVTPLQINAGTAMGEATSMQGFLPLLVGTGEQIYNTATGRWTGNTKGMRQVLQMYADIYGDGLGNKDWQIAKDGRDQSFKAFAEGKVGILGEGDYGWRGVWNPATGAFPMATRNTTIGYAQFPAVTAGAGVNKQDFVSMSGGSGYVLNPNTKQAAWAWKLLTFMNSREAIQTSVAGAVRITQRNDVNAYINRSDPLMTFVSTKVMPTTFYRPADPNYNAVSVLLQKASEDVVNGVSVTQAAATYQAELVKLVGAAKVSSN